MAQGVLRSVHTVDEALWDNKCVRLHSRLCVYNNVRPFDSKNVNNDFRFFDISINRLLTDVELLQLRHCAGRLIESVVDSV